MSLTIDGLLYLISFSTAAIVVTWMFGNTSIPRSGFLRRLLRLLRRHLWNRRSHRRRHQRNNP